jgi:hypothetical protein
MSPSTEQQIVALPRKISARPGIDESTPDLADLGTNGLSLLRAAFRQMQKDPFCSGGYRWRGMSRYDCSRLASHGELVRLPRIPLFQAAEFNPLHGYGGVVRDYPDLPDSIADCEALRRIAYAWVKAIPEALQTLSVHMIRTDAPGAPVPEGRHRDGNDWVGIYVVDRNGIDPESGITRVYDSATDEVIFEGLIEPGTLVTFDDRITLHDTTEVRRCPQHTDAESFRSVFVFSTPDHEHYIADAPKTGEA